MNPYKPPKNRKKRFPKKRGRKSILRRFDQVGLGYGLRVNAPLEFDLIMKIVGPFGIPDADLIEAISYSSLNPFFKTTRFRELLMQYREEGCHTAYVKKPPSTRAIEIAVKKRREAGKKLFEDSVND